jgi:epsin
MNLENLKKAALSFKDKLTKTPFERLLQEATSNENWNVSTKTLREIADHSYNFNDFSTIMKHIWKRLNSQRKKWRKIIKTLTLIDYLLKNGSPRCIAEIKDEIYQIKTLQDFSHFENGADKGAGIREKSKQIVELLNNEGKLEKEREAAKTMQNSIGNLEAFGSNAGGGGGSDKGKAGNYGGFGSESYKSDKFKGMGSDDVKSKYDAYGGKKYDDEPKDHVRKWNRKSSDDEKDNKPKDKYESKYSKKDEKPSKDGSDFVVKSGTKYDDASKGASTKEPEHKPTAFTKAPETLAKPGKAKVEPQPDFLGFDEVKPAPKNDSGFAWDNNAGTKNDQIWSWDKGNVQSVTQPSQPTQPVQSTNLMDAFGELQAAPTSNQSNAIASLYKQPANSTGSGSFNPTPVPNNAFSMGNPQGGNMNNFYPQSQNFMTPPVNQGYNNPTVGSFQQNNQNKAQPTNGNQFNFYGNNATSAQTQSKPVPQQTQKATQQVDAFDDFQVAKPTAGQNEYKGFSEVESSLIDLNDLQIADDKKKAKQNNSLTKKSDDDIDSFFPSSPQKDGNKFGGNATGTFNMGGFNAFGSMTQQPTTTMPNYNQNPTTGFVPMMNNPMGNNNNTGYNPNMMNNNMGGNMGGNNMGYNPNMMNRGFGMNPNPGFPQQQQGYGVGYNQKPF